MTFFQPFRRKFGVVTLIPACVFAAGWVRSHLTADFVWYPYTNSGYSIESLHGKILLTKGTPVAPSSPIQFGSENLWAPPFLKFADNGEPLPVNPYEKLDLIWQSDWLLFRVCNGRIKNSSIAQIEMCIIPYWSIVIPLTLISACLILSKARSSNQKKITEII